MKLVSAEKTFLISRLRMLGFNEWVRAGEKPAKVAFPVGRVQLPLMRRLRSPFFLFRRPAEVFQSLESGIEQGRTA